jgi:ATP phosphoribosyltransferase regulatory subunit
MADRVETGGVAEAVSAALAGAGYVRVEPAILQPASVFLDLAGEDLRARLFLVAENGGEELCLRPEYTIPVVRLYLDSAQAGEEAAFSYCGKVFRQRPGQDGEFVQAGVESFGRADAAAADAEILALTLEALAAAGLDAPQLRVGDAGLVAAFLDALKLPATQLRKLRRGLMRGQPTAAIFEAAQAQNGVDHSGVLAALDGVDRKDARALVEDLLAIAGIRTVGGRSAGEIAERFLEQSAARNQPPLAQETRALIERFLAVSGDPDAASASLRALAGEAGLDLDAALDALDQRTGFLAARGVAVETLAFATAFHRNLDYYTGFLFEARDPAAPDGPPVAGGGRYDRLLRTLGASADIPAVGASIWIERLAQDDAALRG